MRARPSSQTAIQLSSNSRRIAHLDMDAFFASVELLRRPELRGRPVVVGGRRAPAPLRHPDGSQTYARLGDYIGRGVVTTATYEARALDVHSGMGLMKAARLAPDAVLLPADFEAYRAYSARFKAALAAITPRIESRSIDEVYLDLTGFAQGSEALAQRLKQAVFEATGLSCSVAVAPNKLLAKIGSELDKPDGLTVLTLDDMPRRIWPLQVARINGIGPKATARLAALGIHTIGELAQADPERLRAHFGAACAAWMQQAARGHDERPVMTESAPRSISRETTFERDLHPRRDRAELGAIFTALCERLAQDLRRKGVASRTIGVKLRYDDFRTLTRDATLPAPVREAGAIRRAAGECIKRAPLDRPLRLLGVRCAGLVADEAADPRQAALPLEPVSD